jgi:hypothetical protein
MMGQRTVHMPHMLKTFFFAMESLLIDMPPPGLRTAGQGGRVSPETFLCVSNIYTRFPGNHEKNGFIYYYDFKWITITSPSPRCFSAEAAADNRTLAHKKYCM